MYGYYFIGNGSFSDPEDYDFYESFSYPYFAQIPAYATEFTLRVHIIDDDRFENNEWLVIRAITPDIPAGVIPCHINITISDNDGKLIYVRM